MRQSTQRNKQLISALFFSFLTPMAIHASTTYAAEEKGNTLSEVNLLQSLAISTSSFFDRFEAEVWLTDMSTRLSNYIKDPEERLLFLSTLHKEASYAGLEPELVLSVIHVESAFDRFAISHAGALGYMQIMPFWIKEIGQAEDNLMHMETNLHYGCQILRHYLNREKGNLTRALARYNGSLGKTWYPRRVMKAWDKYWQL